LSGAPIGAGPLGPIDTQFGALVGKVIGVTVGVTVTVGVNVVQLPLPAHTALNTGTADGPHCPLKGGPQVMPP
jgi:sorbitol-specific phosphotransferase system component IIBC